MQIHSILKNLLIWCLGWLFVPRDGGGVVKCDEKNTLSFRASIFRRIESLRESCIAPFYLLLKKLGDAKKISSKLYEIIARIGKLKGPNSLWF